ncbi:DUF2778 domain-containing protein [Methylocapsa palsarum]|uniref:DUF2778 domain-containing protein n=1 Tax=Methylocapsa palsarum TaxID=1612308 RepID=UPI001FCD33E1|nr:DUF2778 domain-containing protein [Methylocapsa palsarum]
MVIVALSALFGVWTLYLRPADDPRVVEAQIAAPTAMEASDSKGDSNVYGALFDPGFASGAAPASLGQNFPLSASLERAPTAQEGFEQAEILPPDTMATAEFDSGESAPLPIPRPDDLAPPAGRAPVLAPGRRIARQNANTAVAAAPGDNRNFFEKIFGGLSQPQPSRPVLAYAAPEDGVASVARTTAPAAQASAPAPLLNLAPRVDRGTAVYDVSAHTVYMPNGTRLEAHSGLGSMMDDPRYVHERMRGATPPNVYQLSLREAPFHGVRALRLTPTAGHVYGRTGLLAHRYMLGPNGASNGCVSFRNYDEFLKAYDRGEVQRLAVVARMN